MAHREALTVATPRRGYFLVPPEEEEEDTTLLHSPRSPVELLSFQDDARGRLPPTPLTAAFLERRPHKEGPCVFLHRKIGLAD